MYLHSLTMPLTFISLHKAMWTSMRNQAGLFWPRLRLVSFPMPGTRLLIGALATTWGSRRGRTDKLYHATNGLHILCASECFATGNRSWLLGLRSRYWLATQESMDPKV